MKPPIARVPKWRSVYLVCEACHRRRNGPKKKAKAIASALRAEVGAERPRPRVLATGCLGLCPKKATAVAVVGGGAARLFAIEVRAQLASAVAGAVATSSVDEDMAGA